MEDESSKASKPNPEPTRVELRTPPNGPMRSGLTPRPWVELWVPGMPDGYRIRAEAESYVEALEAAVEATMSTHYGLDALRKVSEPPRLELRSEPPVDPPASSIKDALRKLLERKGWSSEEIEEGFSEIRREWLRAWPEVDRHAETEPPASGSVLDNLQGLLGLSKTPEGVGRFNVPGRPETERKDPEPQGGVVDATLRSLQDARRRHRAFRAARMALGMRAATDRGLGTPTRVEVGEAIHDALEAYFRDLPKGKDWDLSEPEEGGSK